MLRLFILIIVTLLTSERAAEAGFGNLFGSSSNQARTSQNDDHAGRDYTTICREGGPYPASRRIYNAKRNIAKGASMMQSCELDHTNAVYKKGKVMKEIGEKDLADLRKEYPKEVLDFEQKESTKMLDAL